jgi:hypothetical protein
MISMAPQYKQLFSERIWHKIRTFGKTLFGLAFAELNASGKFMKKHKE